MPSAAKSSDTFGKFRLVSPMHQGVSGHTYKAVDTESGDTVLLRIVRSEISKLPQFRRALFEHQTTNEYLIDHPNIAGLRDAGKIRGRHYFATEFADGPTLEDRLGDGPLTVPEGTEVLIQIAEGLRAAHRRQLVHGDLKPADIFLSHDRHGGVMVKVAFFDLATATAESGVSIFGELVGTPKYLAPEQIMGRNPDARSDIYALGVIAYRMFTGRDPFRADNALGFLYANLSETQTPPHQVNAQMPMPLSTVITRMLEKRPEARYQSCQNLIDDLERCERQMNTDRSALLPAGTDSAFAVRAPARRPSRVDLRTLVVCAAVIIMIAMIGAGSLAIYALRRGAQQNVVDAKDPAKAEQPVVQDTESDQEARLLLEQASALETAASYGEATKLYDQVATEHPDTAYAELARGRKRQVALKLQAIEAQKQQERREAIVRTAFQATVDAVTADVGSHDYTSAVAQCEKFIEEHGDAEQAGQAKKRIQQVNLAAAKHDLDQKAFEPATTKLSSLSKQTVDMDVAREATALAPQAELLWAKALLATDQYDPALQKLAEIAKRHSEGEWHAKASSLAAQARFERACALLEIQDYPKAIAELREVTIKHIDTEWEAKATVRLRDACLDYTEKLLGEKHFQEALTAARDLKYKLTMPEWERTGKPLVARLLYEWSGVLTKEGKHEEAREKLQILLAEHGQTEWAKKLQQSSSSDTGVPRPKPGLSMQRAEDDSVEQEARQLLSSAHAIKMTAPFDDYLARLREIVAKYPTTEAGRAATNMIPEALFERGNRSIGTGKLQEGLRYFEQITKEPPQTPWAAQVAQDAQARQQTPEGMVYVPGAEFLMGSSEEDVDRILTDAHGPATLRVRRKWYLSETPQVLKKVQPFYIDRTEVTNEDYHRFVKATGHSAPLHWPGEMCPEGTGQMPVVRVAWEDAVAYAEWANKRLPTEAEWELAAKGHDGRLYPWGSDFSKTKCNAKESSLAEALPVGSFPAGASPYGCLDMCGNVGEWTADIYAPYPETRWKRRETASEHRVYRGGSYRSEAPDARTTFRFGTSPKEPRPEIGFRCARSVPFGAPVSTD